MLEKEYCIGLDISTSCIGVTIMDLNGKLIDIDHIKIPKTSKKNGDMNIFRKADYAEKLLQVYQNYNIKHIFIEAPLKNAPNINTVILLAKFNGIISRIVYKMFNVFPEFFEVHDARKIFFPEFVVKSKKNGVIVETLSFPVKKNEKEYVFKKISWLEPQIVWKHHQKFLTLQPENYDRADSYLIAKVGLYMNNYIKDIPKCDLSL